MKVKEIIEKSAELLGVELTKENTETLLHCYNLVENELAVQYFPLRAVDKVLIKDNTIYYEFLKNKAYRILEVRDFHDNKVEYTIYTQHIELKKNYDGVYFYVCYNYLPKEKKITDACEYCSLDKDILVYGLCAEYCLMKGILYKAREWDGKYKRVMAEKYIKRGK